MLRSTLLIWLLPSLAQGAHILVDVTPENIQKYDIQLTVEVIDSVPDKEEKDAEQEHVTYQVEVTSRNVNLRNCIAAADVSRGVAQIQVEQFKAPILQVDSRDAPAILFKADSLTGTVTFPSADAEKAYLTIIDVNIGASYSYRFKLQDWVQLDDKTEGNRQ